MSDGQPVPQGWETVRLRDAFRHITRRNDRGVDRVLTASGQHGLIDQREFFSRSVAGKTLDTYFLLERGQFAYNRSLMQGYPYGAIKRLDRYAEGVVSVLYLCFALRNTLFDSDFAAQLFDSGLLNGELAPIAKMGARAHGLLNVSVHEFLDVPAPCPPLTEQRKIAAVLSSLNTAIEKTSALIAKLRDLKTAMMQELLTKGIGHTRFKHSPLGLCPDAWTVGKVGDFMAFQRGFDITEAQVVPGEVPVISSSGVSYFHDRPMAQPPGIVTGRKGKIGDVFLVTVPYWPHDTTLWVTDLKGNDPGFAVWFLRGMHLERLDEATAVPTLNRNFVHSRNANFPPLDEQRRIASLLSTADTQVTAKEEFCAKVQLLKKALMQDLLTGRVRVTV